ncbi:SRPBCC domain-containing protein [Nocardia sp. NPDC005978]|uniref:SRPBCC domain-containing protein n=1 Tax=Nocardia sp. NPDC005978 TaxID=3156725 RepID=UPI00339DB77B
MTSTRVEWFVGAPRPNVFRALLDARSVRTWMVPDGMTGRVHEFEPRVGGRFRISLTHPHPIDADRYRTDTFHGRFTRLVPNTEVVQTLRFETDHPALQGETTLTYTLSDAPGGTRVTVRQDNLPAALATADTAVGFRRALAKLATLTENTPTPEEFATLAAAPPADVITVVHASAPTDPAAAVSSASVTTPDPTAALGPAPGTDPRMVPPLTAIAPDPELPRPTSPASIRASVPVAPPPIRPETDMSTPEPTATAPPPNNA